MPIDVTELDCDFLAFSGLSVLPTRTWALVLIGLAGAAGRPVCRGLTTTTVSVIWASRLTRTCRPVMVRYCWRRMTAPTSLRRLAANVPNVSSSGGSALSARAITMKSTAIPALKPIPGHSQLVATGGRANSS